MNSRSVYVLYFHDGGTKSVFYVGITNNIDRRLKEHQRSSIIGTEDKYVFIRDLEDRGLDWHMEKVTEITESQYDWDCERFFVIKYIRDGHPIQNMKHGDAEKLQELAEQVGDVKIRSIDDVRKDREHREWQKGERARRLRERVLIEKKDTTKELVDNIKAAKLYSNYLEERLKKGGWRDGAKVIDGLTFVRFKENDTCFVECTGEFNLVKLCDKYTQCYKQIAFAISKQKFLRGDEE